MSCLVKAVFVVDRPELIYYYGGGSDEKERINESNLIQGVVDFALFCSASKSSRQDPVTIETDNLWFLVKSMESLCCDGDDFNLQVCFVFDKESVTSTSTAHSILNRFIDLYFLLHGSLAHQIKSLQIPPSSTLDDFVPSFLAAECLTSKSIDPAIRYAPVDRHAFVAVHSLGLELLTEFENHVSHFAVCYKGFLISTSLEPELFTSLYSYLVMDSCTGSVSHSKLLKHPYGRISTPAVVPGGGSSSFGRCNFLDMENASTGFLFGPTGNGTASVFCPLVYLKDSKNKQSKHFLCVYLINSFMIVLLLNSVSDFEVFNRIEHMFTENNSFNDEIIPLVRSDFAKSSAVPANPAVDFTYRNLLNKSLIMSDKTEFRDDNSARKRSIFSKSFFYSFMDRTNTKNHLDLVTMEDPVKSQILEVAKKFNQISNIAVKKSSAEGWRVFTRRGPFREIEFHFKDPKTPLWKVNAEIEHVFRRQFDSIFL